MATEILVPEIKTRTVEQVHLVARNPQQMAAAQSDLTLWLQKKRDGILGDIQELQTAKDEAQRHKWKTSTFTNHISKLRRQHDFYQKLVEAVMAGYTIVPHFPIDIFAIRVTRELPSQPTQHGGGHKADYRAEVPNVAAIGEGAYVSPKPTGIHYSKTEKDSKNESITRWYFDAQEFQDCEFPFTVARPEIMPAVAEAMALRVFDQIGICPQQSKRGKGDPLIIGQIIQGAEKWGGIKKPVNFLIAWHLDLRTL